MKFILNERLIDTDLPAGTVALDFIRKDMSLKKVRMVIYQKKKKKYNLLKLKKILRPKRMKITQKF